MAGAREPIQGVIAEVQWACAVRQTASIADRIVDVIRLIDLATGGRQLVEDTGDLRSGIIS